MNVSNQMHIILRTLIFTIVLQIVFNINFISNRSLVTIILIVLQKCLELELF